MVGPEGGVEPVEMDEAVEQRLSLIHI